MVWKGVEVMRRILVDSGSSIKQEELAKYNVELIPLKILIGEKEYDLSRLYPLSKKKGKDVMLSTHNFGSNEPKQESLPGQPIYTNSNRLRYQWKIQPGLPQETYDSPYFGGAMRELTDPAETIDFAKIKLAISDKTGRCLYMSRTPVPYPRGSLLFKYKKYVGVECFNKAALDFFVNHEMGNLEKAEDIDHLRFLENGIELHFNYVNSESISVDTPKDLEKVRQIISRGNHDTNS